jgi:DNA-binding NtrC family response regulator
MASSTTRFRAQRPRSALVFVDDPGLAAIVEELLLEEGWEVFDVESTEDARKAMSAWSPSVMIVDVGMAVEELERFLDEVSARDDAPAMVVLSDLSTAAMIAREHQILFVREPFDLEELVQTVECARRLQTRPKRAARS